MDRRSLVLGGGAAAIAAAVAGGRILSAEASTTTAGPTSTADHARRVLELVNVDIGLVNPSGAKRLLEESLAVFQASAPRDPNANDLDAWARSRIADLTGTDSFEAAVKEIPQTRTLLAFGFLSYTQHQDRRQPKIIRSMPVPAALANLEPDFFPELLGQINAKVKGSTTFANELRTSSAELDQFVATVSMAPPGHPTTGDIVNWVVFLVVVGIVVLSNK
jgi:hypothetical protein